MSRRDKKYSQQKNVKNDCGDQHMKTIKVKKVQNLPFNSGLYSGYATSKKLIPYGSGTLLVKNIIYDGTWLDGRLHGRCILYFLDPVNKISKVEGYWKEGTLNLTDCSVIYKDDSIYSGQLNELYEKHGDGKIIDDNNIQYHGVWVNDKKNDVFLVSLNYPNPLELLNGLQNISAPHDLLGTVEIFNPVQNKMSMTELEREVLKYTICMRVYYENDLPSKKKFAFICYGAFGIYNGMVDANISPTRGRFDYPDGSYHTGTFVHGKKNGKGVFTDMYGNHCYGLWKDDTLLKVLEIFPNYTISKDNKNVPKKNKQIHKVHYPNGSYYIGEIIDNQRSGKGIMVYPEGVYIEGDYVGGDYYSGDWVNDKRHGIGVYFFSHQKYMEEFYWENDEIVGTRMKTYMY